MNARFKWTDGCQRIFDLLKDKLRSVSLFAYPDLNKPYNHYIDTLDSTIGALLMQNQFDEVTEKHIENLLYFLSHRLSDTQTRWSTIEKEQFAVVYGLQKIDHYIHNGKFIIFTEHKTLQYILKSPIQNKIFKDEPLLLRDMIVG